MVQPVLRAALTVEGGGTLGTYEGGLTWALVEIFRQRRKVGGEAQCPIDTLSAYKSARGGIINCFPQFELRAVAGASAGSINAFVAGNRWCSTDDLQPEDSSSFWRAWIPTGLQDLLQGRKDANPETALFARTPFKSIFWSLDSAWKHSKYLPGCRLTYGAAITRLGSDSLAVSTPAQLFARNQRYAAAFTIDSRLQPDSTLTYSQPPGLRDARIRLGALVHLPLDSSGRVIPHQFSHDLIKASSGYPLAFEPYPITHCRDSVPPTSSAPKALRCPSGSQLRTSYFVDGGVFDNGPLTIAYALALADPGKLSLDSVIMLFVTPGRCRITGSRPCAYGAHRSSPPQDEGNAEPRTDGLDAVSKLFGTFIPSARQYELQIASRFLPTIQGIDRREDQNVTELVNLRKEKEGQEKRALKQYESLKRVWDTARADIAQLIFANDSLRNALEECRNGSTRCDSSVADSAAPRRLDLLKWLEDPPPPVDVDTFTPRALASRRPFDSVLYVSNRWHPLAGDWLFGFGGLLGRPLREYDFFVGIYDALALISQRILCGRSDSACVRRHLARLITSPPLHLSHRAQVGLAVLYAEEFGRDSGFRKLTEPLRAADSVVADSLKGLERSLTSGDDSVLVDIIKAMSLMGVRSHRANACNGAGPVRKLNCSEGMDFAFKVLRDTPRFMETIQSTPLGCSGTTKSEPKCVVDTRFAKFVGNPDVEVNRLVGELLARMWVATPDESGLKPPLAVVSAMYYATNERARNRFDGGSVSLPEMTDLRAFGMWLIPSSIGGFLGVPGWYSEWAARWHKDANFALGVAGRAVWASGMKRQVSGQRGRYAVPSLRVDWKTPFAPLVSAAGVDVAYWIDTDREALRRWDNRQLSPGITLSLFAQKVRVSAAKRPAEYVIRGKDRPWGFVSIGIGDFNGILYWLARML